MYPTSYKMIIGNIKKYIQQKPQGHLCVHFKGVTVIIMAYLDEDIGLTWS